MSNLYRVFLLDYASGLVRVRGYTALDMYEKFYYGAYGSHSMVVSTVASRRNLGVVKDQNRALMFVHLTKLRLSMPA